MCGQLPNMRERGPTVSIWRSQPLQGHQEWVTWSADLSFLLLLLLLLPLETGACMSCP